MNSSKEKEFEEFKEPKPRSASNLKHTDLFSLNSGSVRTAFLNSSNFLNSFSHLL